jgi:hypothetical protein
VQNPTVNFSATILASRLPPFTGRIKVFHSATQTYTDSTREGMLGMDVVSFFFFLLLTLMDTAWCPPSTLTYVFNVPDTTYPQPDMAHLLPALPVFDPAHVFLTPPVRL